LARATGLARARLEDGTGCEIEEAGWRAHLHPAPENGGPGTLPDPGRLMRASIAGCLAISYAVWGARLDVAIDGVEVDVLCESDLRGQMGIAEVAIGWQRMVIDVVVVSSAAEIEVRRVVETSDRLNPMLANLSPAIARAHHLRVVRPADASR